jgi:hypothetical protein
MKFCNRKARQICTTTFSRSCIGFKKLGPSEKILCDYYLQPNTGPPDVNPKDSETETEKYRKRKKNPTATVFPFASPGHLPRCVCTRSSPSNSDSSPPPPSRSPIIKNLDQIFPIDPPPRARFLASPLESHSPNPRRPPPLPSASNPVVKPPRSLFSLSG